MDRNEIVESLMVLKYCLSSDDFCNSYWDKEIGTSENMMNKFTLNLCKILGNHDHETIKGKGRISILNFVDNKLEQLGWEWYDDWQDDALRAF